MSPLRTPRRPWPRRRPTTAVVTDPAGDDDALRAARDAVLGGAGWRPAADLLAATGPDADLRAHRVIALGEAVVADPAWADAWLAERPGDASALLVRADGEVRRAWEARGAGYADSVSDEARQTFLRRLARAEALTEQAVDAAPDDPAARLPGLWLAIGQQAAPAVFRRRWERLVALDPLLREGHLAALQYWSAKWYGSHEEMYAFARAGAGAAPGTWAVTLPLRAHIEYALEEEREGIRRSLGTVAFWERSDEVRRDLDAALVWAETGPQHPGSLGDLTVVGYCLVRADRMREADELFARLGYRVSEHPWDYDGDPHKQFRSAVSRIGWWLWSEG